MSGRFFHPGRGPRRLAANRQARPTAQAGFNNFAYVATGGITFSGSADYQISKVYLPSAAGIVFGGVGTYTLGEAYPGSGGIAFGGNGAYAYGAAYAGAGGIAFAGVADYQLIRFPDYVGSGGIIFVGVADTSGPAQPQQQVVGGGGGFAAGFNPYRSRGVHEPILHKPAKAKPAKPKRAKPRTYAYVGTGSIVIGGAATYRFTAGKPAAAPDIARQTVAPREVAPELLARTYAYAGSGGIEISGSAQVTYEMGEDLEALAIVLALAA